jgi:BirA family biotin operon repressor/biotin-[acetyl-CoA-carboxylase] ligase
MTSTREQDSALMAALFAARGERILRADLARTAGIASGELEHRLSPYLQAGYPIEFHPQGGVSLQDPPDVWCAEDIAGRCPTRETFFAPGWDLLLLAETSSTNDVAREHARRGARAGFVVAASRQTRGRGRLGRDWESPAGLGLYVSILLRPGSPALEAGQITILSSVAAAEAIEMLTGYRPQIRWPNDLLADGRKLGGLLIETEREGAALAFGVLGIGLNVRQGPDDFSPTVRSLATSLRLVTGRLYRRADLLVALLQALERRFEAPFDDTRRVWEASSLTLGQRIILTTIRGRKYGQALGLDESGALLLRGESGEIETVTAGDMQAV